MANIIILTAPALEAWGNFKKMCEAHKLPYNYLKKFKMPIEYKNYSINRLKIK